MSLLITFLRKYWLYIAIALVALYFVETYYGMEKTIIKQAATIERVEGENKALKEIQKEQKENLENLDIGSKAQSTTRNTQSSTREKINNVPTTTNDRPFSDPGMLARASILRDHQEAAYPK